MKLRDTIEITDQREFETNRWRFVSQEMVVKDIMRCLRLPPEKGLSQRCIIHKSVRREAVMEKRSKRRRYHSVQIKYSGIGRERERRSLYHHDRERSREKKMMVSTVFTECWCGGSRWVTIGNFSNPSIDTSVMSIDGGEKVMWNRK
ncbi:hypothetical protein L1887_02637 [Cichorium endivia]|nr:hypothetical protein L1887_02637 [Cichorium endivia]